MKGDWGEHTAIIFAVVGDHEHDFPFHDVVVHEPAAYARDIFVGLHLFELAAEEAGGCCACHGWVWGRGRRGGEMCAGGAEDGYGYYAQVTAFWAL